MRFVFFLAFILAVAPLSAIDWTLNGGIGTKHDNGTLEVIGTGSGGNAWISSQVSFMPGQLYRFKMEASVLTSGGHLPCGPDGFYRDFGGYTKDWKPYSYVFRVPDNRTTNRLRVGQWQSTGMSRFRNIETVPVVAIPTGIQSMVDRHEFLRLGEGEIIMDDTYRFNGWYNSEGSNYHRPVFRQTAGFNTDHFRFGSENEVVYRFELQPIRIDEDPDENLNKPLAIPFLSAMLFVNVRQHTGRNCIIDISKNGTDWIELGRIDRVASLSEKLPTSLFPADAIFVRIRAERGASFQVNGVNFEATLQPNCGFRGVGETIYAETQSVATPPINSSIPLFFDSQRIPSQWILYVLYSQLGRIESHQEPLASNVQIALRDRILHCSFPYNVYRDACPGYAVGNNLWWVEPEWKISPTLPQPTEETKKPIHIEAVKNDFESFQLVVNGGANGIDVLSLTLNGNLQGANGATISADNVQIRYAYYHFVQHKTDKTGLIGEWPDALPSLEEPLKIEPNRNQPLWVTVRVPTDAVPGKYNGTLTLHRGGIAEKIPFTVHVWNFALPERNRHATAFGLSTGNIFRYHNCRTVAEQRAVFDMYQKNFSDYRVSPYNPVPLDPIRVTWNPNANPPSATIDFTAYDMAMERAIQEFKITNIRFSPLGMRRLSAGRLVGDGSISGYAIGTPEHEAMFKSYVQQVENHFRQKGWLDMVYVYRFDEPATSHYPIVAEDFARLQKYAPGLKRMVTEGPRAKFVEALEKAETSIDIWCTILSRLISEERQKEVQNRQALGESVWCYVCTFPKAPYCSLFIDHPGTSLRVWFWQAFERDIVGSLVWESVWWRTAGVTPNQNPYEDPMSYNDNGGYWGNGDGRFVYPPLEAAIPGRNGGRAILKPPVSSIRWEMVREGIQDIEMLYMLQDLKTKRPDLATQIDAVLVVPTDITSSLTEWTFDPVPIYEHRRKVAQLLEQ